MKDRAFWEECLKKAETDLVQLKARRAVKVPPVKRGPNGRFFAKLRRYVQQNVNYWDRRDYAKILRRILYCEAQLVRIAEKHNRFKVPPII